MSPISLTDSLTPAAPSTTAVEPVLSAARTAAAAAVSQLTSGSIPSQPIDPTAARRPVGAVEVNSENLTYTEESLYAKYSFHSTNVKKVETEGGVKYEVKPVERLLEFKTERKVPKTGCVSLFFSGRRRRRSQNSILTFSSSLPSSSRSLMLVGLGGNNGTTLTATVLANRHNVSWGTRDGIQTPNYLGSLVRASTMRLGVDDEGNDVHIPVSDVLPMVHPNDLVVRLAPPPPPFLFFLSSMLTSSFRWR